MDETKVLISEDVLLNIGIHSDWYISSIGYDGESVDVALRRKADRNKEWWLADTPQTETKRRKYDVRNEDCKQCQFDSVKCSAPLYCELTGDCKYADTPQTDYNKGLQLFADILFDKDKSEQFLEECKAMGIEPQTENWYTYQDEQEYNARYGKE